MRAKHPLFQILIVLSILTSLGQMQACAQASNKIAKMKLIYIMDPQCGWCYGNSKNISTLQTRFKEKFDFELLTGGMWLGQNAPLGGAELSSFLAAHAPRMAATTGMEVGQAYYELAKDSSYPFSSLEPSAAIVLIKNIAPDLVFDFSKKVQVALLVEGKRLDALDTYLPMLKALNIDAQLFESQWMQAENLAATQQEFTKASAMANGFPTLLLEQNGQLHVLASGYFDIEAMQARLEQL